MPVWAQSVCRRHVWSRPDRIVAALTQLLKKNPSVGTTR